MNNRTNGIEQQLNREATELRAQASDLLNELLDHREQSEARFAEIGQIDPMKSVTGKSAIDNAIECTRRLLRELEALSTPPPPPSAGANGQADGTAERELSTQNASSIL